MYIYEIEEKDNIFIAKIINVFTNSCVLYQPFNPITGENFKTREEAEEYIKEEYQKYQNNSFLDMNNKIKSSNDIINEVIDEILSNCEIKKKYETILDKNLILDTIFKYSLNINISDIDLIINKDLNLSYKKYNNYRIDTLQTSTKIKQKFNITNDILKKFSEISEDIVKTYVDIKYMLFIYNYIQSNNIVNILDNEYIENNKDDINKIKEYVENKIKEVFNLEVINNANI